MRTKSPLLVLGLLVVACLCPGPLAAQDVVPPAQFILVVPAVSFEPAQPRIDRPRVITTVGFIDGGIPTTDAPAVDFKEPPGDEPARFWARGEYLLWRVTAAPVAVPLVSSNSLPNIGALNEPGTTILFGAGSGQDTNFGTCSGARVTLGGWLDKDYECTWEFSGFVLERRSFNFNAASAGGQTPGVSIPFNATEPFNPPFNPAGETALSAGGAPSNAAVHLTSQLWNLELNEMVYLSSSKQFYCAAVLGFRHLNLTENLTLVHTTFDTGNNGTIAVTDGFGTRNQFYGAQVGTRFGMSLGRWNIDAAALFAVGPMYQHVYISGATTVTNGAFGFVDGSTPGGVFAEPSNIGSSSRNILALTSDLNLKVGFAVTPRFQPYCAYNALYVSSVARPGNQIDRNVNPTQNAFFVPPGTLTGTASPLPMIRGSDFWAHGLQIGMEFRF